MDIFGHLGCVSTTFPGMPKVNLVALESRAVGTQRRPQRLLRNASTKTGSGEGHQENGKASAHRDQSMLFRPDQISVPTSQCHCLHDKLAWSFTKVGSFLHGQVGEAFANWSEERCPGNNPLSRNKQLGNRRLGLRWAAS